MLRWERSIVAGLSAAVLLLAGCTSSGPRPQPSQPPFASPTQAASAVARPKTDTCLVTTPTEDGIPKGLSESLDGPVYGQGPLWVGAWWADEPTFKQARELRSIKYPLFTIENGKATDDLGPPRVEAIRLDGEGRAGGGTGGYARDPGNSGQSFDWWPTGIDFPSHGCWQVTQTAASTSITYVVRL